jgi:hypothetical protein
MANEIAPRKMFGNAIAAFGLALRSHRESSIA